MQTKHGYYKLKRKQRLKLGESWGRVQVIRSWFVDAKPEIVGPGVLEFRTDLYYAFRCDCREEFEIRADQFEGRASFGDCGCGLWRPGDQSAKVKVTLPKSIYQEVKSYADGRLMPYGRAVLNIIEGVEGGAGWDWRGWDGMEELPEECWKWGVSSKDRKMTLVASLPAPLVKKLKVARYRYGVGLSRVVAGLVWRGLYGVDQKAKKEWEGRRYGKMGQLEVGG